MNTDLRVAELPVRFEADEIALHETVRAAWRPALCSRLSDFEELPIVYRIQPVGEAFVLGGGGNVHVHHAEARYLCRHFERAVIDLVCDRCKSNVVIHSAGLIFANKLLLVVGDSGGGKSSMTREALRRGGRYLSDDMLVLQDGLLSGVPRTVQFDPIVASGDVPDHVQDCDVHSYWGWPVDGKPWRVPLYAEPHSYAGPVETDAFEVVLVRVQRGPERKLTKLSSLDRLRRLHGATLTCGRPYQKGLDQGPGYDLIWDEPEAGFELLHEAALR